jgi:hypothetical protein
MAQNFITVTADKVIAEDYFTLKGVNISDIVTSVSGISTPGSDEKLVTEATLTLAVAQITYKVKVSNTDSTGNYLYAKIAAGTGITKEIVGAAGSIQSVKISNSRLTILSLDDTEVTDTNPNDVILFWNHSEQKWKELAIGDNLSISASKLNANVGTTSDIYRAGVSNLGANQPSIISFSAISTDPADLVIIVDAYDSEHNPVIVSVSNVTYNSSTTDNTFTAEASKICTLTYYAFLRK